MAATIQRQTRTMRAARSHRSVSIAPRIPRLPAVGGGEESADDA
jgi:hypothetical protein